MNRSVDEQVKSGFRLGVGCGSFLVGIIFLAAGLKRVAWSTRPGQLATADWVGWLQLAIGSALLFASAHIWHWLLGGFVLFGLFKTALMVLSGTNLYPPYGAVSRWEAAGYAGFALATLVLLFRFRKTRPTPLDRSALTAYVVTLLWIGKGLAVPLVGLVALAISWCIHHWQKRRVSRGLRTLSVAE